MSVASYLHHQGLQDVLFLQNVRSAYSTLISHGSAHYMLRGSQHNTPRHHTMLSLTCYLGRGQRQFSETLAMFQPDEQRSHA